MKALIVFIACAGMAVGQTTPTPIVVQEPVTQPVLHCPDGWHVEVWHEQYCITCGTSVPFGVIDDHSGYRPYMKPLTIMAGSDNTNPQHPAKCVKNPPAPKPDAVTPAKVSGEYWGDTPLPEKDRHYSVEQFYGKLNVTPAKDTIFVAPGQYCMPDEIVEVSPYFGFACRKHAPEKLDAVTPETTQNDKTWKGDNRGDLTTQKTNPLCTDQPSGSDEGCKKGPEHAGTLPKAGECIRYTAAEGYTSSSCDAADPILDPVEAAKSGWSCTMTPKEILCVK